jgi:hypothetical protein
MNSRAEIDLLVDALAAYGKGGSHD